MSAFGNNPAFGAQATSSFNFGSSSTAPTQTANTFGSTQQPTSSFGGGGGFGASQPVIGFGSNTTQSQKTAGFGTSFGTVAPTNTFGSSTTPSTSSFSGFGTAQASQPSGGFGTSNTNAFGTTQQPSSSFGFGTTTPQQQQSTTVGFGSFSSPSSFGAPKASTTSSSFGFAPSSGTATTGFGATQQPSTSAFGGFGLSKPSGTGFGSATAQPSFGGFGGFNTPSTTSAAAGGGGFPTMSSSNQPTTTPGTTTQAIVPSVGTTSGSASVQVCEFPVDTLYHALPEGYKLELDRTWKDMKQPMKQKLDEIARYKGSIFDEVAEELKKIYLAVLNVENEQRILQGEIKPFVIDLQDTANLARLQAAVGLQQLKSRNADTNSLELLANYAASIGMGKEFKTLITNTSGTSRIDEDLPCKWYIFVAEKLSNRLNKCLDIVHSYERKLSAKMQYLHGQGLLTSRGQYGQIRKVGLQELVICMQEHSKIFLNVAADVAVVHKETEHLRQLFLSLEQHRLDTLYRGSSKKIIFTNPFDEADRKEAAEQRVLEQKLASEASKFRQQQLTTTSNTNIPNSSSTNISGNSSTNISGNSSFMNTGFNTSSQSNPLSLTNTMNVPPSSSTTTAATPALNTSMFSSSNSSIAFPSTNTLQQSASGFPGFTTNAPITNSFINPTNTTKALDLATPSGFTNTFTTNPSTSTSSIGSKKNKNKK